MLEAPNATYAGPLGLSSRKRSYLLLFTYLPDRHCSKRLLIGKGETVTLTAESGGGKTRLLQEFIRDSRRQNIWPLLGQARAENATRPLHVFNQVVFEVVQQAHQDPEFLEQLTRNLGDRTETLAALFPEPQQ